MSFKKAPVYPLKALDKSLAILDILSQERSPLSIAELSEGLGNYSIGSQPSGYTLADADNCRKLLFK